MTNTNKKFNLILDDADIYVWDLDRQGDYLGSKDSHEMVALNSVSRSSIASALTDLFGVSIDPLDLYLETGVTGMVDLLENDNGEPDDNGDYLVRYNFSVITADVDINLFNLEIPANKAVDLSKIKEN